MKHPILACLFVSGLAACGGTSGSNGGNGGTTASGGAHTGGHGAGGAATGGQGTGGNATGGHSTGGTATGGTGGATGCGPCDWSCCGSACTNLNNDILNCGSCGTKCSGDHPFCDNGKCAEPPCEGPLCGAAQFCCGTACCDMGDLCCVVPGPVQSGPACTPPNEHGTCPQGCSQCVCASPDSPIATPAGERPIRDLAAGDLVYSVHRGQVVAVPILEAVHVAAPDHVVIEVTLENGRTVDMSPKHPTADGRTFGALRAGDSLEGQAITRVRSKPFAFPETYDILPDSDTGTYFAAGALVGSTLSPGAPQHCGQARVPETL